MVLQVYYEHHKFIMNITIRHLGTVQYCKTRLLDVFGSIFQVLFVLNNVTESIFNCCNQIWNITQSTILMLKLQCYFVYSKQE